MDFSNIKSIADSNGSGNNENITQEDIVKEKASMMLSAIEGSFFYLFGNINAYCIFKGIEKPTAQEVREKLTEIKKYESIEKSLEENPDDWFLTFLNWYVKNGKI